MRFLLHLNEMLPYLNEMTFGIKPNICLMCQPQDLQQHVCVLCEHCPAAHVVTVRKVTAAQEKSTDV